jgi:hypothetical protein
MFQRNAPLSGNVQMGGRRAAAPQTIYTKFPAILGEQPSSSPEWIEVVNHQFDETTHSPVCLFRFTCMPTPEVQNRLWDAHQATLKGEKRYAFDVVVVTSLLHQNRTIQCLVSLEKVAVINLRMGPLSTNQPRLLEVEMSYQSRTGLLPSS